MKKILLILAVSILWISCKKDPEPEVGSKFEHGIFCVNEGLFQQNNASISFFQTDSQKVNQHVFASINGRGLGDTANDAIFYYFKGKPYYAVAVDVSSQIEIIDAVTLKSVKQISVFDSGSSRSPRSLEFYNNHLYSLNFDGTISVIDLSSFDITKTISVGLNPDNSIIIGDELFCVNSGGLNAPDYDNTVSVIDLNANIVTQTFETAINCSDIIKDDQNNIYLLSRGNYSSVTPKVLRIDPISKSATEILDADVLGIAYFNNVVYFYDETQKAVFKYNTSSQTTESSKFIDCSDFDNFYGIYINTTTKTFFLVDANGYVNSSTVHQYNHLGQHQYSFTSGLNTGQLLFIN